MKRTLCLLATGLGLAIPGVASAETFDLMGVLFCPTSDPMCGYSSLISLRNAFRREVGEMNLEYTPADISYRPMGPIVVVDDDLASITNSKGKSANGKSNATLIKQAIATYVEPFPERATIFLSSSFSKCWNALPCPGEASESVVDQDEVVFCGKPKTGAGKRYAHEFGHYFCLQHTFSYQDAPDDDPPDHDNDGSVNVCKALGPVTDTPADPGNFEKFKKGTDGEDQASDDGVLLLKDEHEWCIATTSTILDYGSPHKKRCDVACYVADDDQQYQEPWFSPYTQDAMSYYRPDDCRGPWTLSGVRREAFTPSQIETMQECRAEHAMRQELVDVCKEHGGDADHDGWCADQDLCPSISDTKNLDSDFDGIGDRCDPCPHLVGAGGGDLDHDGIGDQCDPDRDNDGCTNVVDLHPDDKILVVGEQHGLFCHPDHWAVTQDESGDTDGDGLIDCADYDDDNDHVVDWKDDCPIDADPAVCNGETKACAPVATWALCALGLCGDFGVQVSPGYPDPSVTARFDHIEIVDGALYLAPLANHTASESLMAFRGQLPFAGGRLPEGKLSVDLVEKERGRVVAHIASIDPRELKGDVGQGMLVRIEPGREGERFQAELVWSIGARAGDVVADADLDGIPDFADDCVEASNADQADADDDGFGDACDADFDQDGRVGERDYAAAKACIGVDLALDRDMTPDDPDEEGDEKAGGDGLVLDAREPCLVVDLDGDGAVTERDLRAVEAAFDRAPGPSGLVGEAGERRR
ncbi:MAG: hypothetical protein U1F43_06735 [Myxococcota bacterium]